MKELKLAYTDRIAIVDDEDFERLSKFKWRCNPNGHIVRRYAVLYEEKHVALGNEILRQFNCTIDHADRNPLNNQKSNLRVATWSQNNHNKPKRKYTSSRFIGVSYYKSRNKWLMQIVVNRKRVALGYYKTEIEAASAYNKAAIQYFKEFANLNKDENGVIL